MGKITDHDSLDVQCILIDDVMTSVFNQLIDKIDSIYLLFIDLY